MEEGKEEKKGEMSRTGERLREIKREGQDKSEEEEIGRNVR